MLNVDLLSPTISQRHVWKCTAPLRPAGLFLLADKVTLLRFVIQWPPDEGTGSREEDYLYYIDKADTKHRKPEPLDPVTVWESHNMCGSTHFHSAADQFLGLSAISSILLQWRVRGQDVNFTRYFYGSSSLIKKSHFTTAASILKLCPSINVSFHLIVMCHCPFLIP